MNIQSQPEIIFLLMLLVRLYITLRGNVISSQVTRVWYINFLLCMLSDCSARCESPTSPSCFVIALIFTFPSIYLHSALSASSVSMQRKFVTARDYEVAGAMIVLLVCEECGHRSFLGFSFLRSLYLFIMYLVHLGVGAILWTRPVFMREQRRFIRNAE